MPRAAPGVERAIAVLEHLAEHGAEGLTLSELARRLRLSKATAHALLGSLTGAGYLVRHPTHMTYTLGPALVVLGTAATHHYRALEAAQPEIEALSDELGLECLASVVIAGHIVILDRRGDALLTGASAAQGQRVPLAPPVGGVFLAWADDETVFRWLDAGEPDERDQHLAMLAAVRARGYSVGFEVDARTRLGHALAELAANPDAAAVRALVERLVHDLAHEGYAAMDLDIDSDTLVRVSHIAAPVFGAGGRVDLALTLVGFPPEIRGGEVRAISTRLLHAAAAVTRTIRGAPPAVAARPA